MGRGEGGIKEGEESGWVHGDQGELIRGEGGIKEEEESGWVEREMSESGRGSGDEDSRGVGPGRERGLMKHHVPEAENEVRIKIKEFIAFYPCEGEDWWHNKCNQKS